MGALTRAKCLTTCLATFLASLPALVAAQEDGAVTPLLLNCSFTTECYETEGCQDTLFAATLVGEATGPEPISQLAEVEMRGDAEDVQLLGHMSNGALGLVGGAGLGRHMLTVSAEGTARYTVHFADGPRMVSYTGQCEAAR